MKLTSRTEDPRNQTQTRPGLRGLLQATCILTCLMILAGCSSTPKHDETSSVGASSPRPARQPEGATLRVGIAPDYPPLAFEQSELYAGAEIDLAIAVGKELKRPVLFVPTKREDLVNALLDGRVDIVMSGMSVTKGRQLRVKFAEPYLQNQLRAVYRRTDEGRFAKASDVTSASARVGVLSGTTSDIFVQTHCPNAQRIAVQNRRDVAFWLTDGGKLDLYIDDIFALAEIVSKHEAALVYSTEPLAMEDLAWALPPGNDKLLEQINQILARWKSDGTLDRALRHWMPYLPEQK